MADTEEGVRMILEDYDAAPDGSGTFQVLDAVFPSVHDALSYHRRYLGWCWGTIKKLDGTTILTVQDIFTQEQEEQEEPEPW